MFWPNLPTGESPDDQEPVGEKNDPFAPDVHRVIREFRFFEEAVQDFMQGKPHIGLV